MSTDHPDEGTIHAWLDGALSDAESARLSAHVAGCAACSAATAEARGLIAGASRVVRALDDGPSSAAPLRETTLSVAPREARPSPWWRLRVTPARAAIAATLLVAAGLTLTRDWAARESALSTPNMELRVPRGPAEAPGGGLAAGASRDPLLDSAIRRNVAQAVPPRSVERAPGPGVRPEPPVVPPSVVDESAPMRVAVGRRESQARRDSQPVVADQLSMRRSAPAVVVRSAEAGASAMIAADRAVAAPAPARAPAGAGECLQVESATPGAAWGGVRLPFVVALGTESEDRGTAHLVGAAAAEDSATGATWARQGADSLRLELHRSGYSGAMQLALGGDARAGVMWSASSGYAMGTVGGARARTRKAAPAAAPATETARGAVEIVARRVSCP